jgi:hypothetical protein
MELNELTPEERVALVALLELAVEADATVSEDEVDELREIVEAVGEESYRAAAAEVDTRFQSEDELKAFLQTITRQEARELIYEAVLEAALPDAIGAREAALLDWLAKEWAVTVQFEDPETEPGS